MARVDRAQEGQSLVEIAVVLPLLVLILLGVIDLGRVFHAFIVMENAAREGARYAASHPGRLAEAETVAADEAAKAGFSNVDVAVGLSADGESAVARVGHQFALVTGFLGIGPIRITGTASMPVLTGS